MYVKVFSSISEIPAQDWDSILGPDTAICSHAYLSAVERSGINDCVYRYPVVYDELGFIVAHTCIFSITMDLTLFATGLVRDVIRRIRRVAPSFLTIRMLECGTPVALGRQISVRPGADTERVIGCLVPAIESIAGSEGLGYVLFRDYRLEDRPGFDALCKHRYELLHNLPDAVLEIRWDTFDDYVSSMRSNYRRKLKLNLGNLGDRQITCELLDDFRHLSERFVEQWMYIYNHATEYKREILTREFYENINSRLPGAKALVFYENGRIIAHCLLLFEDTVLRWMYVGKQSSETEDLYPFMLYEIVRIAIAAKMRWVKFGITTYVAKTDLGAELTPLYMYMKHRTWLFPKLAPWLFRKMTPLPNLKPKSVFKTSGSRAPIEADPATLTPTQRQTQSNARDKVRLVAGDSGR